jgi:hypothetical protein
MKLDYMYIRAWGRMMGSNQYYIDGEIEQARRDRAPQNVVYQTDGVWRTFDRVTKPNTIALIEHLVKEMTDAQHKT